jgi:general secretion pathway protein K
MGYSPVLQHPPLAGSRRQSRGFALIVVLWTLVLIAFIVAQLTSSGRTEVRIAGNLVADAAADAADDGAIFAAIFNLSDPNPAQRWPLDGAARELTVGDSRVMVRLEDEAGRINPNLASLALLEALLRVTGSEPESARRLAGTIGEWVGSAPVARPQNAVLADYSAAGLDYGPPSAPIETLDELGRVIGMTPVVLTAIRPHLTLFGPPDPNPASADPVVAAALAQASPTSQAPPIAPNQSPLDLLTVRIEASAVGPSNARVSKTAIVRVGAMLPSGYTVLAWGSEALD